MKEVRDTLMAMALVLVTIVASFIVGRCTTQADEPEAKPDTITRVDTITILDPQPQLVTQEIVKYKYVPITVTTRPDTIVKRDTIIQVQDGVAVIPISMKTYTDSSTYKAVVSGYDPRLEEIEVYQPVTVITHHQPAPKWSVGLQGGLYLTPAGLQPGIGIGINRRISK